jgi:hypothetical protein
MKSKTIKGNNKRFLKRIVLLISYVLFGLHLSAQYFDFTIPAELLQANRVRAVRQEIIEGYSIGTAKTNIYTYDNNGKLEQIEFVINKVTKGYAFYKYDSSGKLIERTQRALDSATRIMNFGDIFGSTDETRWTYEYDSVSQRLLRIVQKSKKGNYGIDSVFYNPKKIKTGWLLLNGTFSAGVTRGYDKFDNMVEEQYENIFPTPNKFDLVKFRNIYNSNNNLLKVIAGKGKEAVQYDYLYFDNGLLKSITCKKRRQVCEFTYRVY